MKREGKKSVHVQDIPAATESAGQAAAAVDGVFHVLAAGEEAAQEEQEGQEQGIWTLLYLFHLHSTIPAHDVQRWRLVFPGEPCGPHDVTER